MEMAADAEARRVDELTALRKQDAALIRQLVEALENSNATLWEEDDDPSRPAHAAITAGRARLEGMTDKPTPTTDLLKRCAEIHEWRSTGVLSGEALRDYAKRKWPGRLDTLQMAEHETVTEALALLAKWGQPAQAAEPFCWHWENTFNGGTGAVKKNPETLGINMSHPDYKWTALYTAQPPTHAQAGAVPLTCEWTHNEDDGFWETACGEAWRFDDGGPGENNMHFCHSCGNSLRIKGGQHGTE